MVTSGGRIPHQLPRAVGSNFSCAVICKDKCKISILLRIDNTTTVAYIIIWGYSCSLQRVVNLTKDLWMWCLEKNIHITAQHLPGAQNFIAAVESRSQTDRTDWKLNPCIFTRFRGFLAHWKWTSMQLACLPSANATSAGGQIHLQKQQLHFSKCGRTSRGTPTHPGTW